MAKKKNDDTIIDIEGAYSKTEAYVEQNKKRLTLITTITALAVIAALGYRYLYAEPLQNEAKDTAWKAQYYFSIDSLDLAMNGDGAHYGFQAIANQYSGTPTGELAQYYLGLCYLQKGQFEFAIDNFNEADLDDEVLSSMVLGNMGNAYVELGDLGKGEEFYKKAMNNSENGFTKPLYAKKLAMIYEKQNNTAGAYELYKMIKEKYPKSTEGRQGTIEKDIARLAK